MMKCLRCNSVYDEKTTQHVGWVSATDNCRDSTRIQVDDAIPKTLFDEIRLVEYVEPKEFLNGRLYHPTVLTEADFDDERRPIVDHPMCRCSLKPLPLSDEPHVVE
jgi:hypothetical protein